MLKLRSINPGDKDRLVQLLNNPGISKYMADRMPYPYTPADADAFFELVKNSPGHRFFAIIHNEELIGGAGLHPQTLNHSHNLEVGYWIGEPYWGKGYATETIKLLLEETNAIPNIHKIFARTYSGNIASERALEKNGFILEGILKENVFKAGRYLDEKLFGLIKK